MLRGYRLPLEETRWFQIRMGACEQGRAGFCSLEGGHTAEMDVEVYSSVS